MAGSPIPAIYCCVFLTEDVFGKVTVETKTEEPKAPEAGMASEWSASELGRLETSSNALCH